VNEGSADDAVRAGFLLGWLSVAAVLIAVVLGLPVRHDELVVALALAAGLGNGVLPLVLRRLAPTGFLDLWAGLLLVFVAALMVLGGATSRFDLLLFLVLPFIAITHEGRRLAGWLAAAAAVFAAAMALAPAPLETAEIALHAVLLIASVILAVALARGTRRSAAAAARAAAAAELEQALLAEAHHRIKNSLQTVADLLLLGRPEEVTSAAAFDATAARIRSIAAVHHLLAGERGGTVAADELLRTVVAAEDVTLVSDDVRLHSAQAQQLAMIAGELLTNALRHGGPPVTGALARRDGEVTLTVRDAGRDGPVEPVEPAGTSGLGLTLVRQIAERGLGGGFTLDTGADGSTTARLRFNVDDDAHPDRRGRPGHSDRPDRPPEGARA
jgi:two-component sensor histidine kinase